MGTLLAGFFLVPKIGLPGSVLTAAILNLAASAFFYTSAQHAAAGDISPDENHNKIHEPLDSKPAGVHHKTSPQILYVISFLSGFYVMTLENALIRLTNLSFGSSSYSFAIIVSVFILLIAAGSFIVSRLRRISTNLLCFTQVIITVSLLAVYISMDNWPYLAHLIRISCQSNIERKRIPIFKENRHTFRRTAAGQGNLVACLHLSQFFRLQDADPGQPYSPLCSGQGFFYGQAGTHRIHF
jgi:hypothetical protein